MSDICEVRKKAIDEINSVCEKHGVFLIGTCYSEGIYGEITIGLSGDNQSCRWIKPELLSRDVDSCNGDFVVELIGHVNKELDK